VLEARHFSPGISTDAGALLSARALLRKPGLALAEYRDLYRTAAQASLDILARPEALGESMRKCEGAFRRALGIEK
jgi:hypothetical protein